MHTARIFIVCLIVGHAGAALAGEAAKLPVPVGAPPAAPAPPAPAPVKAEDADTKTLRTVWVDKVVAPDVIECKGVGRVHLIGIHSPEPSASGYQKALKATQKFAYRRSVKLDPCPVREKDSKGARARVFYLEGGKWHELNAKLLRAGLASAVNEQPCHRDFSGGGALVQAAKEAKRGLFSMRIEVPLEYVGEGTPSAPPVVPIRVSPARPLEPESRPLPPLVVGNAPKEVKYLGNIASKTFHTLDCFARPADLDLVFFADRINAVKAGYRACVVCRPK